MSVIVLGVASPLAGMPAAAAAQSTWSGGRSLAVGYRPEVSAAVTPAGRAVAFFAFASTPSTPRVWTLGFRVQTSGVWSAPVRVITSAPTAGVLVYSATVSNDRAVVVAGIAPAPGRPSSLLLREVSLTGRVILTKALGAGAEPAVAVDRADNVAVVVHADSLSESVIGGWTVGAGGRVASGVIAAGAHGAPGPSDYYYEPQIVALGVQVFGVAYILSWYPWGDPSADGTMTVDEGSVVAGQWQRGGLITSGDNSVRGLGLIASGNRVVLAASNVLDPATGRSELLTTTSSTYASWTSTEQLATYYPPQPRLAGNVALAPNGYAAVVTDRVHISEWFGEAWFAGPAIPVATGRCGAQTATEITGRTLHWFAAVPVSGERCSLAAFSLVLPE